MFVPKCAELIRLDEERGVVMTALEAYATLLEEIKGDVLIGEGHREAIMNSVIDVLTLKVRNMFRYIYFKNYYILNINDFIYSNFSFPMNMLIS